jgi:restriction-modification enzyme MmeI-like protein
MGRHGKRLLFVWADVWTLVSDATKVFAFDDDYSMGTLSSSVHNAWAKSRSSSIKGDPRYTNTSCFETFPWPYPTTEEQRERIAEAIRKVITRRQQICAANSFGLTTLYSLIDDGAYTDLKALHRELDEVVAAAYGWPKVVAQDGDEIVQRLLILNREIAVGTRGYDPFDGEPICIPPPRAEASRLTLERQPRRSGAGRPPGAREDHPTGRS